MRIVRAMQSKGGMIMGKLLKTSCLVPLLVALLMACGGGGDGGPVWWNSPAAHFQYGARSQIHQLENGQEAFIAAWRAD
jgi:hypothetical protein